MSNSCSICITLCILNRVSFTGNLSELIIIISLGSNSKAKFNKAVGVDQKSKAQKTALKTVKLKHNTFYSFKELKDLVKCAYDKSSAKCTAKATDVQSVYSVKSTSRNGARGYLIIGKI